MPGDDGPPPYEVLAGLAASLRGDLADALTALEQARAQLAQARERIAELEARLRQNRGTPPGRRRVRGWISRRRGRGRCGSGAAASRAGRTGMRG